MANMTTSTLLVFAVVLGFAVCKTCNNSPCTSLRCHYRALCARTPDSAKCTRRLLDGLTRGCTWTACDLPSICENGGTCTPKWTANYTCNCPAGYEGRNCEKVMPWLGSNCTNDTDCIVQNSECFAGQCLCTPGYFYYNGSRTCQRDCANLINEFVEYKGFYLSTCNFFHDLLSRESCRDLCETNGMCVTFQHISYMNYCGIADCTPLDAPNNWIQSSNYDFWQRMCA